MASTGNEPARKTATDEVGRQGRTRHRPTATGSALAVAGGAVALGVLIDAPAQWLALGGELTGLGAIAGGYWMLSRGRRSLGRLSIGAGAIAVAAAILIGLTVPRAITNRMELVPGLLGLGILGAGLVPVRLGRERVLVAIGATFLLIAVLVSGVVRGSTQQSLLLAGVATVFAWDLGEHAVSLGRQVGRGAPTLRGELVHAGGTLAVGLGTAVVVHVVSGLGVTGLSLTQLLLLLVAGFVLVVAARH